MEIFFTHNNKYDSINSTKLCQTKQKLLLRKYTIQSTLELVSSQMQKNENTVNNTENK